jgi:probable F420-dependent oxidoreductase
MQVGLHALGIGAGARRDIIDTVARCAESAGIATLWAGEHVVMVDEPASRYPYADDGRIAIPADADWLDPLVALSFAAAATSRIRLATGIMLLPEHNPVLAAKQTASIDVLSGGRLSLGVGVGWSAEEFAALGVPFAGRGRRMDEYIDAMRTLWRDDVATFHGEYVSFDAIRVNPRPVHERRIPIVIGGNGDTALRRAARTGDGWYGFYLSLDETAERLATLRRLCEENQREPGELRTAVAVLGMTPGDRDRLEALGLDEVVLVDGPPEDASAVEGWLNGVTEGWIAPA